MSKVEYLVCDVCNGEDAVEPETGLHIFKASQGTHYHAKGIELVALDLGAV